jgi:hypothetical protein
MIPYVKDISDKFRRTGNLFNVRIIFKTKHTLRGALMKTGPVRDVQQTKQCVYNIPYVKGISEKFRRTGNSFNIRSIFKSKHTLRGTLTKTGPVRDAQQTKQCMYSIPCDCGKNYIGETSKPLEVGIKEHKYNLTQSLLKKLNQPNMRTKKGTEYV